MLQIYHFNPYRNSIQHNQSCNICIWLLIWLRNLLPPIDPEIPLMCSQIPPRDPIMSLIIRVYSHTLLLKINFYFAVSCTVLLMASSLQVF